MELMCNLVKSVGGEFTKIGKASIFIENGLFYQKISEYGKIRICAKLKNISFHQFSFSLVKKIARILRIDWNLFVFVRIQPGLVVSV